MTTRLRLGTRASLLATTQSDWIRARLMEQDRDLAIELVTIRTEGDRLQDVPADPRAALAKGLFTTALEDALRAERIDLAVHSLKDLPTGAVAGLVVAAIAARADPRDVLLTAGARLRELPAGAVIGTGSPRRVAQLLRARPDLRCVPLRGNVDTRIRRLRAGAFDGIVLAAAGLARLGRLDEVTEFLDPEIMLPAPGQGALAVQMRDEPLAGRVAALLDHSPTRAAVCAERALLEGIGGGCDLPLGALASAVGSKKLRLRAVLFSTTGGACARADAEGDAHDADALGRGLARRLRAALAPEGPGGEA